MPRNLMRRSWFWLAVAIRYDFSLAQPLTYIGECDSTTGFLCGNCEGDCDGTRDCESGLWCYERVGSTAVPGCEGQGEFDKDYCIGPVGPDLQNVGCTAANPCGECEGGCSSDAQCEGSFKCFSRTGFLAVPGCTGRGTGGRNYCYDDGTPAPPPPTPQPATARPTPDPTKRPSPAPTTAMPTPDPTKRPSPPPTTAMPTPEPTKRPTPAPTTPEPTSDPTDSPTSQPTVSVAPTAAPSISPTALPSDVPSPAPTITPAPTDSPSTSSPTFSFVNVDVPERLWFTQLGSITQKGNAVTASPDGVLLYITMANGSLKVLSASDGQERWSYAPGPGANGWSVKCTSGVAFGELDEIGKFAVYSVIDEAPVDSNLDSESRLVAVSHPSNQLLWTSSPLRGEAEGTPFVTRSSNTVGRYIFVTHNSFEGVSRGGFFSVLSAGAGSILFTEAVDEVVSAEAGVIYTYGPPGGSHFPIRGMYARGVSNTNDFVVWATSDDSGNNNGRGRPGLLRAFQLPMNFDPSTFDEVLTTAELTSVDWSSVTRPTLSIDGTKMFITARRSEVHGWVDTASFEGAANWTAKLTRDDMVISSPILNDGILSADEARFFTSSRVATFAAVDVATGSVLWEESTQSTFLNAPKVSRDDERVYAIQSTGGRIYAWNQISGDTLWSVSCDNYEEDCANRVEAEFYLSEDSLVLVYVDVMGRVTALQVGTSRVPTAPPTDFLGDTPSPIPNEPSPFPTLVSGGSTTSPSTSSGPSREGDTTMPSSTPVNVPTSGAWSQSCMRCLLCWCTVCTLLVVTAVRI